MRPLSACHQVLQDGTSLAQRIQASAASISGLQAGSQCTCTRVALMPAAAAAPW